MGLAEMIAAKVQEKIGPVVAEMGLLRKDVQALNETMKKVLKVLEEIRDGKQKGV